jgi:hypothetical protein
LAKQPQSDCHDTLPWLISISLGLMTAQEYLNGLAAYRDTFWPEFVQHDDCIFLALNPTY